MTLNHKNPITLVYLATIFTIFNVSCKKEEKQKNTHIENPDVFTITSNQWYQFNGIYYFDKSLKEITQKVIDEGAIMVYVKEPWEDVFYALPFSDMGYYFKAGKVTLFYNDNTPPNYSLDVKVVIFNSTDVRFKPKQYLDID